MSERPSGKTWGPVKDEELAAAVRDTAKDRVADEWNIASDVHIEPLAPVYRSGAGYWVEASVWVDKED
jgi:hypothetical protein